MTGHGQLAIVVPYRDREQHRDELVPALSTYLDATLGRDGWRGYLAEQAAGLPFNRGALNNAGFLLARQDGCTHVCFHDVDYVPVEADYSAVDAPTRLIWYGADRQHDYAAFFSAVVAFPSDQFLRINGYSNEFWGWGFEDEELRLRCIAAGLQPAFRDGTFRALPHVHQGFRRDHDDRPVMTTTAQRNLGLLQSRAKGLRTGEVQRRDGVGSLRCRIRRLGPLAIGAAAPDPRWQRLLVEL